jgi:hypothetical protein
MNKLYQTLYLESIQHGSVLYSSSDKKYTLYIKLSEFDGNPPEMISLKLGE